jgi:hypothetical protein
MSRPCSWSVSRALVVVVSALALIVSLLPRSTPAALAQEEPRAAATLRVVQASPGAPPVDVLLDGQPLLTNLSFGNPTNYVTLTSQEHRLQVVPSGQTADAAIVDQTIDAAPRQAYLLAVYGRLNDLQGAIYEVDLSEIEPGNARVRLINFSPDAGNVDLLESGGDEWFSDVGLGEASDYRDIAPGVYSADLRGGDNDRVLRTIPDVTFEETRVYDLIVVGQIADDSLEVQSLETPVSPPCSEVLGIEGAGSDACVRMVHAAPDAPAIDVYVNDAQIAKGLDFGTATEYTAIPSGGDRGLRVVPSGSPIEDATLDESLDFDPGQAYEILVTGAGDTLALTITGTDLRPLPAGQARLRLIHASPDAGAIDLGVKGQDQNLFSGVNFGDATNYLTVDAGDYPLEIRPGGDNMTVALQSEVTIEEGQVYDFVALGRPEDKTLELLMLTAPALIQIGAVATPQAVDSTAPAPATVVPETIGGAATPAG